MYRRAGFARYARQPFVSSLRPSAPPLRLSSSGLEPPSSLGIILDRVRGCFDETDRSSVGRRYASTAQDPNYSPASELHNDGRASSGPERPRIRANLFQLRPYQEQCVNAVLSELSSGQFTRLGVSAPTGSGKTAMFTSLIASVPPRRHPVTGQEARQVLVVVNSIQLATQTAEAIQRAYPDMIVEVEQGKSSASGMADVTVATFQTLAYNSFSRLEKFLPETHKAVIVDEAHHAAAPSYIEILSRFDPLVEAALVSRDSEGAEGQDFGVEGAIESQQIEARASKGGGAEPEAVEASVGEEKDIFDDPDAVDDFLPRGSDEPIARPPSVTGTTFVTEPEPLPMLLDPGGRARVPLLAFTATWGRADGMALGKIFEKIVWHADWLDMVRGKWLSDIQFTTVRLNPATFDLDKVEISPSTGDFNLSSLARAIDPEQYAAVAVDAWFEKAQDRRSTLIFGLSVAHVVTLTNTFRARGIDARFVYEGTKQADRVELYRAFRAGEFPVLVNYGILTEGADFPEIDCVLLARPTRSQNLFLQMLGRGLRLSPASGKQDCLVIDLVGTKERVGLVNTPTLFGLDPLMDIDGQSVSELQKAREERQAPEEAPLASAVATTLPFAVTYKHYATAFDLVESGSADEANVPISRMSRNAWVGCGDQTWVLELLGQGYIRVGPFPEAPDNYQALLYQRLPSFIVGPGVVRFEAPKEIALHPNLPILLRTVDAYVKKHKDFGDLSLGRYAPWRLSPPTDAQRKLILAKALTADERAEGKTTIDGVWIGKPWREQVDVMDPDAFTKGQACDILTRTMYGGLRHWKKQRKELVRADKTAAREGRKAEKVQARKEKAEEKKAQQAAERERKRLEKVVQKMQARRSARGEDGLEDGGGAK